MPSGMKPDGPVGPDVWDLGETESQMGALNSMVVILGDLGHCLVGTHSCENRDAELKVRALSWGQLLRGPTKLCARRRVCQCREEAQKL